MRIASMLAGVVILSSVSPVFAQQPVYVVSQPAQSVSKGPLGCPLTLVSPGENDRGRLTQETCAGKDPIFYGDCLCIANGAVTPFVPNLSYAACVAKCTDVKGTIDASQGVGKFPSKQPATGSNSTEQNINALCWKPSDCADAEGSFAGEDLICPKGQGKCRAPEPTIKLSSAIGGVTTVTGIRGFVNATFRFLIGAAIIAAAVMFVWAGVKYIWGSSLGSITSAKDTMVNAVIGLILIFSSTMILNTLNPGTTSYGALDIYMINPIYFGGQPFCRDYQSKNTSKPLKFAESGDPPGSISYDTADAKDLFTKAVGETMCNKQYYAKGFSGGAQCSGSVCLEKGFVCLSCEGGVKGCKDKTGAACVKATVAGNITWTDGVRPRKVYLLPICNAIQPGLNGKFNSKKVADNVPIKLSIDLNAASGETGTAAFVYGGSDGDLTTLRNSCSSFGGLRGVVLGVIYTDIAENLYVKYGANAASWVSEKVATITLSPTAFIQSKIFSAIASKTTLDDVAIITKMDCGNTGTKALSAYADGTVTSFDSTDMKTAIYCGARIAPGGMLGPFNSTFYANNMWTEAELKQAMTDKAIECNFGLTPSNAPPDPGTLLEGTCAAGWCAPTEKTCND